MYSATIHERGMYCKNQMRITKNELHCFPLVFRWFHQTVLIGIVKPDRDEQRVRQRYLRMNKDALVERSIATERILVEQRE